jgi:hypothetical protein
MKGSMIIILFLILIGSEGCSVQNKVVNNYKGRNENSVIAELGNPTRIENLKGGGKIDIYEKQTMLGRVPINTGGFRYDRFDSPRSTKIETYLFYISPSGLVEDVKYDYRYER